MAIRTTTTRTTRAKAIDSDTLPISFEEVVQSYLKCCKEKRRKKEHLRFQLNLSKNLHNLHEELVNGTYEISQSTCFIVTRPKPREIWAADFRDRIVHHIIVGRMAAIAIPQFSVSSCACIKGRGTLYGAKMVERVVKDITNHWNKGAYYIKKDISNFFASINKNILYGLCRPYISNTWEDALLRKVLFHDPTSNFVFKGKVHFRKLIPRNKSLMYAPKNTGLPIGDFSSQFLANVYMNLTDQFVKHELRPLGYMRYVDDLLLFSYCKEELKEMRDKLEKFVNEKLSIKFNPTKTIIQPVDAGVDFVGYVILPWRTRPRRSLLSNSRERIREKKSNDTLQSYLGIMSHAKAHRDSIKLNEFYTGVINECS